MGAWCTRMETHSAFGPSQEQWDRLLVLYPTSLAIFSEEADGLCFKVSPSPPRSRPREVPCAWGWEGAAAQEEPVFRGLLGQRAGPTRPACCPGQSGLSSDVGKEGPLPGTWYHPRGASDTVAWGDRGDRGDHDLQLWRITHRTPL